MGKYHIKFQLCSIKGIKVMNNLDVNVNINMQVNLHVNLNVYCNIWLWSFFNIIYTFLGSIFEPFYIQNHVITNCVIKRLKCNYQGR